MKKLIGISGKIGSGKSTLAGYLMQIIKGECVIESIGNEVKRECSRIFGFDLNLAYSQGGKNKKIYIPAQGKTMTIREILQWWGTDIMRTLVDPDHWIKAIDRTWGSGVIIIDDIRFPNEADYIKKHGGYLIRLDTTFTTVPLEIANHSSETELDDYQGFDVIYRPEYGTLGKVAHELDLSVILGLES